MKVFTVIGARPQFIKAAVTSRAFLKHRKEIKEILVHTGQHYDANMSDVFFEDLKIPHPDYNLCIGGGTHGQNTGRMIEKLEELMIREKPDWVLVYGDTDSTLAGALAAAKLHIPVAHIESGLRSFNRRMPEEINRVITDHLSTLLFAPTEIARQNLINEGIKDEVIHVVGDVMFDASLFYKENASEPTWFKSLNIKKNEFLLCTIHRAENTDTPEHMRGIFKGLEESKLSVILPLHPRTRKKIEQFDIPIPLNVQITDPVGYLEMVWLEANCKAIATDSGGVQKEAYFHKKPCITLRNETEWLELVQCGWNNLTGPTPSRIKEALTKLQQPEEYEAYYGSGNSAKIIVEMIK